jgi:hypothetical protein
METLRKKRVNLNPSTHYWYWLYKDMKIIKKSALMKNPAKLEIHPMIIKEKLS